MNNYSTEQLQKIVDDAPDGAEYLVYYEKYTARYLKERNIRSDYSQDTTTLLAVWCDHRWSDSVQEYSEVRLNSVIKLSDIRAELQRRDDKRLVREFKDNLDSMTYYPKPEFKVGDLVVLNIGRKIYRVDHIYQTAVWLDSDKELCDVVDTRDVLRHATPEEEAAGHRIDEPSLSNIEKNDTQTDLSIEKENQIESDTITAQLDPAKCHKVDPTVYDAPTDSPRDDFGAMSESHRSPSCKCHEFPFDAELIPDAVNHPSHYTSDPSGIECIEITRHRNFNVGNAIKYLWRAGRKDQAATVQDLQKAIWYINDEIARLEGEQGE